ncbi:MAG: ATP-dependent protease La domain-containing protein [Gammaproteobacteria bacterium]|nr:MAG: ATP-dependent protease La domain-containing protein [Gammaproteobacteria bacterium]RLA52918.1 MAG: ATP-dependent protease La domain-containing protein [Gammaproteobacteria bacterium]
METSTEIPLFPLQMVLYPTIATRLQVFEQRYLRLVRESLAEQKPFGVVPITKGKEAGSTPEIYPWGTLVTIQDWDQLPNGLFGIAIKGEQRLHVESTRVEDDGLMIAEAKIYEPDPDEHITFAEDDLVDMLESLAKHMGIDSKTFLAGINKASLAWRLAGVLPVQPELKMSLLAKDDVEARLFEVKKWVIEMKMRQQ